MTNAVPIKLERDITDIKYDIEGDLDDAISHLQKARTRFRKEGWSGLRIDIDTESDYYGERSYASIKLKGWRMETQAEADTRVAAQLVQAERQKAYDLKQFEALKAKLGK